MTCIVGIGDGKNVWIGGDSAGTNGWFDQTVRSDVKVFENGTMVFGFCGSYRMGQLLRHALKMPKHYTEDETDDMTFLVTKFINAVRETLKTGGWGLTDTDRNNGAERGGNFLIGYRGQVYEIQSDFQVSWPTENVAAVGCGDNYALGSLHATSGKPRRRIKSALEAAERYSAGVAGPYTIIKGGAA